MCERCTQIYIKLNPTATPSRHLAYKPGTYPVIFNRTLEGIADLDFAITIASHARKELKEMFGASVGARMYTSSDPKVTMTEGKAMHMSVLIDFPHEGKITLPLINRIFGTVRPDQPQSLWSVVLPKPGQDLCLWRLEWFEGWFEGYLEQ
ncbi:uncharacterized protein DSM5745_11213 [Aspergillus mulundensis]|uniref:Uncharacterized protein n=1 Tax=Aspergillus mulundensis TaxID=1810919 RepID=A0A3D8Q9J7_9EURO|nr:hypothetical protein DSM5745_11213 [Aspergillus mulundensis]RDW58522.1 hypothetical protein DSM5745_11213 [Aspergillus mulundensis]